MCEARWGHSSVSLVDNQNPGNSSTVVVIGGRDGGGRILKSTEIYNVSEKVWNKGPDLPIGIVAADCVPAPTESKFSCYLVGGYDGGYSPKVYALSKDLNSWEVLGDFGLGRTTFVALPLS